MKRIIYLLLIVVLVTVSFFGSGGNSARAASLSCGVSWWADPNGCWVGYYTRLVYTNSVSIAGTVTTITCYNLGAVTSEYFGMFYYSGGKWYCRSSVYIGSATAGSHTYTVSLSCQVGDVIGWYCVGSKGFGVCQAITNSTGWRSGNFCTVGANGAYTTSIYTPSINGTGGNGPAAGVVSIDSISTSSFSTVESMTQITMTSIN